MRYEGLSDKQADEIRRRKGSNELKWERRSSFLKEFASGLGDPIMKTLLGAMALDLILSFRSREWYEPVGIALAVFVASLVSAVSEYGSETAFIKLQRQAGMKKCRVVRGGRPRAAFWNEIVCGDIVLLQAGEAAPADGILISGALSVDQSAINGESREVKKRPGGRQDDEPSAPSCILRGTVVTDGQGVMKVTRVGADTLYGRAVTSPPPEGDSPLRLRLTALSKTVSRLGYVAAAAVAVITLFKALWLDNGCQYALFLQELKNTRALLTDLLDAATLAISVLVVAVPEGLPMMITVALSKNMMKMTRDNVMVRKLVGIETAGSMNILFCDKTGTLTQGRIRVCAFITPDGKTHDAQSPPPGLKRELGGLCFTCSASICGPDGAVGGNATDRALMDWAIERGLRDPGARQAFLPFSPGLRISAGKAAGRVYIKGAPEIILSRCSDAVPDAEWRAEAARGRRVIALATADEMPKAGVLPAMRLCALCVLEDRLRPQTRAAVQELQGAGIKVVMITGDSLPTARSISREAGIRQGEIIEGGELDKMTDEQVRDLLPRLSGVARAMPEHKSRLVAAARSLGLTAGMTGDGVNDAPALRAADVGFAMGSGTECAKHAGDIVILDDDVSSIAAAVLYGRTIFRSIRKFIVFQLTMNMCAVGVSIAAPLLGIDAPITVMQMLWINMIMDTLAGLAFSAEPCRRSYMREPPKNRREPILDRSTAVQIIIMGGWMLSVSMWFLCSPAVKGAFRPHPDGLYHMTGFFALFVYSGVFAAFTSRTESIRLLRDKNPFFFTVMLAVAAVQTGLIYFGGPLFRTSGLLPRELLPVVLLSSSVLLADLARKCVIRARLDKAGQKSV